MVREYLLLNTNSICIQLEKKQKMFRMRQMENHREWAQRKWKQAFNDDWESKRIIHAKPLEEYFNSIVNFLTSKNNTLRG